MSKRKAKQSEAPELKKQKTLGEPKRPRRIKATDNQLKPYGGNTGKPRTLVECLNAFRAVQVAQPLGVPDAQPIQPVAPVLKVEEELEVEEELFKIEASSEDMRQGLYDVRLQTHELNERIRKDGGKPSISHQDMELRGRNARIYAATETPSIIGTPSPMKFARGVFENQAKDIVPNAPNIAKGMLNMMKPNDSPLSVGALATYGAGLFVTAYSSRTAKRGLLFDDTKELIAGTARWVVDTQLAKVR